jgi:membrane carboxypeptidase/penicillin-binding protein
MNTILIKILATALAFSQVTTRPDAIKQEFDPKADQAEVAQLLSAGCLHMRKSFDIEQINLDDLIATAMDDKGALGGEIKALKGLSIEDLHTTYKQFCKNEKVENSPVDLTDVISFYNTALKDLPDAAKLKGNKLPGMSQLLDGKGQRFAEVFTPENRRVFVPIADIPESVRNAFIAAEDKRFMQHRGVDERGLVRAFIGNLAQPGRPQGGSTITQQLVKTLLVGNDVTYERKLREIILASNIERALSKTEILELYLNSIYLGRGAWGVELASRAYFGKPVNAMTPAESAFIAGLAKGPNYFNPDRNPERARERFKYVLGRMADDKVIAADDAKATLPTIVAYERLRQDTGFHFVDQVQREARAIANVGSLNASSYVVRTSIQPQLQRATESILQEGLARYELNTGRAKFTGAEANLTEAIATASKDPKLTGPAWLAAMKNLRMPLYDVHWEPAVIVENGRSKKGDVITAGLADGRLLPLNTWNANIRRQLKVNDVVYVRVREAAQKQAARAELRIRPSVQGSILVMENKTGRMLAMAGAFSYPDSQLNRAVQSVRQPGSTLKPLTYLTALQKGLQPNTLVADEPLTLPPIGGNTAYARMKDYWSPKNADGGGSGIITLRRALEGSRNLATAQLMAYGLENTSEAGLDRICEMAVEAQLYKQCSRFYPFILGSQPLRLIDIAAFYAAIANEGARPVPHAIDSIEQQGREIYKADPNAAVWIGANDRASFFQLKSMLQGVLMRGTARAAGHLAPYAAGKTGTTDNELDAWFVGFTNEVTVAIWVGYDNADGNRKTLGRGQTGGRVALPMFEPVLQSVWALYAPKTALAGPSKEAMRDLVAVRVDAYSGETDEYGQPRYDQYGRQIAQAGQRGGTVEYLKKSAAGGVADTRYQIVSGGQNYGYRRGGDFDEDGTPMVQQQQRTPFDFFGSLFGGQPPYQPQQQQPNPYGRRAQPGMTYPDEESMRAPRRIDPDYFFGRRQY